MTQPYREAEAVNKTEVEIARTHEAEETKRHVATLREKGRSERREAISKFVGYDGAVAMIGFVFVVIIGTSATIAIMGAYAHWFK